MMNQTEVESRQLRVFHWQEHEMRGRESTTHPVTSVAEGAILIERLATADPQNTFIIADVFILEVLTKDGEWEAWYSIDGDDLDEYIKLHPEILGNSCS